VRWKKGILFPEKYKNANIIPVGIGKKYYQTEPVSINPLWKKAIYNAAIEIKPDIIMPREIMLAGAAAKAGKKLGIPVIMDMAENYPAAMKEWKKYRGSLVRRLLVHKLNIPERVEKNCVPKMDGIITVCREQNERLIRQYNYPPEKMGVVHNTPSLDSFKEISKEHSGRARVFGHHGNVTGDKRIDKFVMGFIEAAKVLNDIELHIYGAGEYFDDLNKMKNNSHCANRIKLTGKYDFADVPKIVESFDIGIIPYQLSDFNNTTIHNKVFDYFAAGTPVLLSDTMPFRRLIEETNAGIIVDCENPDKITEAIINMNNHDLKAMSANALLAAETEYNWDRDGAKLIKFLGKYL
jgi:glycosyltransferase involved in cell wall biosynthesis